MADHPLYDTPYGKITQFERKLAEAGLDASMIDAINKKRGLAKTWVEDLRQRLNPTVAITSDSRFDRYKPYLLSLDDQLNKLIEFNDQFWGGLLTSEEFTAIDIKMDHIQSVDDLEILYVDFGSPEENMEMWWKVIAASQPNAWRWDELKTDANNLRLGSNTCHYNPGMRGIYRIRVNLVAHWEPEAGRSVSQVREQAAASGEVLAHAEVLAAIGLHDELLRQQDGTNLPYTDMAGFEVMVSGAQPWTYCPYLFWDDINREVYLNATWVDNVYNYWAAPVVRES
jgi:hypothetical protein